ncbi:MAG: hypothetical protein GY700_06515 [Propionibacteriaceae bacterium]|nr:hypothetical protein [Propionibacteriaceae bacterium]
MDFEFSEETKRELLRAFLAKELLGSSAKSDAGAEPTVAVVITTEHRGVFFGRVVDPAATQLVLHDARNCIYWHKSIGGFMGLAEVGPNSQCKIGRKLTKPFRPRGLITSVMECTDTAAAAWDGAPCAS